MDSDSLTPLGARVSYDFGGLVAIVTGSSRGMGRAFAEGLLRSGARVVINGRDADQLEIVREELEQRYGVGRVTAHAFDVGEERQVAAAVDAIEREVGPISILVNNTGVQHREPLLEVSLDDWQRVMRTNVTGAFIVGREVARRMERRRRGCIVNIGSIQVELARPSIGPYTASKGALKNLTASMAAEWSHRGIRVNCLAPGYIETDMTAALRADRAFDEWVTGRTPAARWGRVEDVVGPLLWLCSDDADFVHGQVLFVDGGMRVVV